MNSVPGLKVMLAGSTTSLMKELLPQTCYVPKIQIKIAAKVTAVDRLSSREETQEEQMIFK
jgi:hypothetical protein